MRKRLIPPDGKLESTLRSIWRSFKNRNIFHRLRIFRRPFPFNDRYVTEDNSQVTLFTDDPGLHPDYPYRCPLANDLPDKLQVSLIATVKNEAANVARWTKCIQEQTRPPDEVVILDGGSTDGTDRQLIEWGKHCDIPVRVIQAPGVNISRGRNLAIRESSYPIIAITDFGCQPKSNWLELLIQPFILAPETRVSAGFYEAISHSGKNLNGNGIWPESGKINPQAFLPSSRSVAIRKDALEAIDGYAEWLTRTGEDTYLDLELKRLGGDWAFVPEARVLWEAPAKLKTYLQKIYHWASGDGETGVNARYYWNYLIRLFAWLLYSLLLITGGILVFVLRSSYLWYWLVGFAVLWLVPVLVILLHENITPSGLIYKILGHAAHVIGFLKGASRNKVVEQRKLSMVKGWFFILSGVPMDDTGGGSRGTQIALELLRQGCGIVFLHKFPRNESRFLDIKFVHSNLFRFSLEEFNLDRFNRAHPGLLENSQIIALLEFPLPDFLPIIHELRDRFQARMVYDLLDDWQTSLGGKWYASDIENEIITSSHLLVATLPSLAARQEAISGRKSLLLPNAVNHRLFNPKIYYPRPVDLPTARRILIYVGALWGEWFDWELIKETVTRYPQDAVVVIGDYRSQCIKPPANLCFLGLKPQTDLPAYLAHADLALVPWKDGLISQATSPLKVYEYLAMRLPVLAPRLEPLRSLPGLVLAESREEFIRLAGSLTRESLDLKTIDDFIGKNTWQSRIRTLLEALEMVKVSSN